LGRREEKERKQSDPRLIPAQEHCRDVGMTLPGSVFTQVVEIAKEWVNASTGKR